MKKLLIILIAALIVLPLAQSASAAGGAGPDKNMLKGLIMMLMALDHFIYFINRFHPSEFWIVDPPLFPAPAYQVFRLLTHLCAPGFVFLRSQGGG